MAPISCEIRKLILHEWVHNKLSYRRLAKKFNCSKTGVEKIIRKFGEHCTLENLPKNRSKKRCREFKKGANCTQPPDEQKNCICKRNR